MERSSVSAAEIEDRLGAVNRRVQAAARRAGRDAEAVRIVAISKSHPAQVVRAGYSIGLRRFGENRIEEALPKQTRLQGLEELEWHMVGHIQSRKAKSVPGAFQLVHSVDRSKIARRLSRHAGALGLRLPVLLECNVSGEGSKFGWSLSNEADWPGVVDEFTGLTKLPNLEVVGLMTMAPIADDPEQVRPVFRKLRKLQGFLEHRAPGNWSELSMGMTDDFEVAVEEGATVLRIGRAIFGPRREG